MLQLTTTDTMKVWTDTAELGRKGRNQYAYLGTQGIQDQVPGKNLQDVDTRSDR